eukprot:363108-Chlamydomonas_euryale.AAC.2
MPCSVATSMDCAPKRVQRFRALFNAVTTCHGVGQRSIRWGRLACGRTTLAVRGAAPARLPSSRVEASRTSRPTRDSAGCSGSARAIQPLALAAGVAIRQAAHFTAHPSYGAPRSPPRRLRRALRTRGAAPSRGSVGAGGRGAPAQRQAGGLARPLRQSRPVRPVAGGGHLPARGPTQAVVPRCCKCGAPAAGLDVAHACRLWECPVARAVVVLDTLSAVMPGPLVRDVWLLRPPATGVHASADGGRGGDGQRRRPCVARAGSRSRARGHGGAAPGRGAALDIGR